MQGGGKYLLVCQCNANAWPTHVQKLDAFLCAHLTHAQKRPYERCLSCMIISFDFFLFLEPIEMMQ